ncbi:MAG: beta-N-acetylhexosaminidase [Marinilabiliales bacterium]|nr:beta-N-acetylhexosaminidase [Marinilabiliales bacterium]
MPSSLVNMAGTFSISSQTKILINSDIPEMHRVTNYLCKHLEDAYSVKNKVIFSGSAEKQSIFIRLNTALPISRESYYLTVNAKGVILQAVSPAGLFYGIQTLIQMMPPIRQKLSEVVIPAVEIKDMPRFSWRGLHLDVGRHFMPTAFIKQYLDYMAIHKLNTFHWHLTDDQGWRIEIKKYPLLTTVGSVRKETVVGRPGSKSFDGTQHGGFYTQEEIKEIVSYAADRFITVVPEIEMPGHALAALAAYPDLGCTGGPYEVATSWGVFDDVFCPGKENTFTVLEDILTEIIPLFPGEYFHIGGDECPKSKWQKCADCKQRMKDEGLRSEHELQSYFIQRIGKFLNDNGKKIIGWDEIMEGGLTANAAVMSWRGEQGGITAAKERHMVVMTPGEYCYFDHYQADPKNEPLAIGGFLPLKKVYNYDPVPAILTADESHFILGAQGNVWTEYLKTPEQVEYMVFPRAAALAEALWSPKSARNYDNFKSRLNRLAKVYDLMGIHYCKTEFHE